MRRTSVTISVLTVAVAAGLSACGGSDESADPAAQAVTAQVRAICDERALSFAHRGDFPIEDFDPENPTAGDLPAVGNYFAEGLDEQPRAIAKLRDISARGEQRERLEALIEAWEAEYEHARVQVDAALDADVDAFVATLEVASAAKDTSAEAWTALGVPDCGQG